MNSVIADSCFTVPLVLPARDEPYRLREVWELVEYRCRQELVFDWSDCYLSLRVDEDTDSFPIPHLEKGSFVPSGDYRPLGRKRFRQYLGKECFWTWSAANQQGYCDCILMSFEGIIPNVLLHTIGSSIQVFTIRHAKKKPVEKSS